jgi:starch-binding outer membrane protein, SusD/RagB family
MKKMKYLLLSLLVSAFVFTGCDALLDADSERYTFEEEFRMSSAHDTLYSMIGVFSQLQQLGDRYVLLGELRGELMETTDNASRYLKEINDFSFSDENPYIDQKAYYAVINSCNYITHYIDTAYSKLGEKPNYKAYAAAKSVRAWTYLQIALNFETVKYYSNPIYTVADATRNYPTLNLDQLSDSLITDLLPLKDVSTLDLGTIGAFISEMSVFPIKFILGDLYLWKKDYANAARLYYDLIYTNRCLLNKDWSSLWTVSDKGAFSSFEPDWNSILNPYNEENLGIIASSPDYGSPFTLDSLSYHYDIAPTAVAKDNWNSKIYFHNYTALEEGDLRAFGSYYHPIDNYGSTATSFDKSDKNYIVKYQIMNTNTEKCLVIYRNSLLYLRYAEAVNRLNCPQLAFAVLKSGLTNNNTTLNIPILNEMLSYGNGSRPSFMNFTDARFMNNSGVRMRGLGYVNNDSLYFIIPAKATLADTVQWVEDMIIEELAWKPPLKGTVSTI